MSAPLNIAAERAAWLQALCADRAVALSTLRVAVIIGNHVNGNIGEAWPSQSTIAGLLSMSRPHVNRAISTLVQLGYLAVRKDGQRNRYSMATRTLLGNRDHLGASTAVGTSDQVWKGTPQGNLTVPDEATNPSLAGYAIGDEHRMIGEGGAYSALPRYHHVGSSVGTTDPDDQDSAPSGAVLSEDQAELAAICFPNLNEQDHRLLEELADTVGPNKLTVELVNLGMRRQAGDAQLELPDWVRAVSIDANLGAGHAA